MVSESRLQNGKNHTLINLVAANLCCELTDR